jgi:PAS domain S-box-containing protein
MKSYKRQIYLFLYMSLLIVLGSFAILFFNFRKQMSSQNEVKEIEGLLIRVDSLTNNLLQIESNKRGFQLTSNADFLDNYYVNKMNCFSLVTNLKKQYSSKIQGIIISKIDSLIKLRIANLDSGIVVFTTKGLDESVVFMQLNSKKDIRDSLYHNLNRLKYNYFNELKISTTLINKRSNQNLSGLLILLLIFVILMLVAARTFRRAQKKIIDNHVKFKEAQRIAKIGSWEWDISNNKLTWSQEQFRLFGRDRRIFDLNYEGYLSHFSAKEKENTAALIKNAIEGKGKFCVEHEITRGDGSTLMVFEQGTVLMDEKNRPTGMFGTTQDITERKMAECELIHAQKKIQAIIDNSADGIYQSNIEGKFIMVNTSMAKIFGYNSPDELISSITDIGNQIYADPSERSKMAVLILEQGHIENYEIKVVKKNKETIWVSANIRVVKNENGIINYFEGILEDITERKKAAEEIKKANERFDLVILATSDGIWEWNFETGIDYFSPQWCEILGYDFTDASLLHTYKSWEERIHKDHISFVKKELIAHLETKRPFDVEYLHLHQSGHYKWHRIIGKAIFDKSGKAIQMAGSIRDISSRKEAEATLLNLSNRMKLAVKATSIGIWDWDITNNTCVWDEEMFKIYNVDPLNFISVNDSWTAAVHPEDLQRVNEELRLAIEDGKEYDSEFRICWKDGSIRYVKGNALVLTDPFGIPQHMVGTNTDITVRKEAELEILQLNQSLDQFANITAHDLQEPIRMVSGFLGLLEKKYGDTLDEQGKSYVFRAKDGADRMSILIKDLLEFSRSGNKAAKKEPVDFAVVMDLVKKDLSIVMADTGATIHIPESLPVVTGTQSALYRLILNLISNGIKFRKKDTTPEVKLCFKESPGFWEFTLQDNGIGVAEKDQPKLFQAFQRLHRREEYPGTGLGLVTCKKIIETHGGKIWMTSEVGNGTGFHFTISKEQ